MQEQKLRKQHVKIRLVRFRDSELGRRYLDHGTLLFVVGWRVLPGINDASASTVLVLLARSRDIDFPLTERSTDDYMGFQGNLDVKSLPNAEVTHV